MRWRALTAALALMGAAAFLGATVLRDNIASAAQTVGASIVGPLDDQGNVMVHEQGTASVRVANDTVPVSGTVNVSDATRRLLATSPGGLFVPHGDSVPLGTVDTTSLSQLRIAADGRDCTDGVSLSVTGDDAAGPSGELVSEGLNFGPSGPAVVSRVLDVPGTRLSFLVTNASSEFDCTVDVTVWGR
jgi:hypothetical protein